MMTAGRSSINISKLIRRIQSSKHSVWDEHKEDILMCLKAYGKCRTRDIITRTGIGSKSCDRMLSELVCEGLIIRFKYGWYRLPER
jgi:Mn-dependent DtxR family transcriptional regulator